MLTRSTRVFLEVVVAIVVVVAGLVGFMLWRMSEAPVSIGFLRPHVQNVLADLARPLRIEIDDARLGFRPGDVGLDIVAVGVRAIGGDGRVHAVIPELGVSASLRDLVVGTMAPTRIDVIGPRVAVIRDETGAIGFDLADRGGEGPPTTSAQLIGQLLRWTEADGLLSRLSAARVLRATLDVDDRRGRSRWRARMESAEIRNDDGAVAADLALDVALGDRPTRFLAALRIAAGASEGRGAILFRDLRLVELTRLSPDLEPATRVDATVAGELSFAFDLDGKVLDAGFSASAPSGTIRAPGLWPNGLRATGLAVKGRVVRDPERVILDELVADLGGPTVAATAEIRADGGAIVPEGTLTIRNMALDALPRYWPESAAPNPRAWIAANLKDGTVRDTVVQARLRVPRGNDGAIGIERLAGTMQIEGATIRYLDPMPPVRGANAAVAFTTDRFDFTFRSGSLEGLSMPEGTATIGGLDGTDHRLALDLQIQGPLRDKLALLAHERLRLLDRVGLKPDQVGGSGTTRLGLRFPLVRDLGVDQLAVTARSELRDVAIREAALGRDMTNGTVRLAVDQNGMQANGDARFAGIPVRVSWTENFRDRRRPARSYRVTGTLDDAGRRTLDLVAAPYVTGPVAVDLSYQQIDAARGEATIALGLDNATLALAPLGWKKPPGAAGRGALRLVLDDGRLRALQDIAIEAADLRATGSVAFADDGRTVASARIDALEQGATAIAATLARGPGRGFDVAITGRSLDAGPLLAPGGANAPPSDGPPMRVSVAVDRVLLGDLPAMAGARATLENDGRAWVWIDAEGALAVTRGSRVRYERRGANETVTLAAPDAGAAVAALRIDDRIKDGTLDLKATRAGDAEPWKGEVKARDFRVVDSPALGRLFAQTEVKGPDGKAQASTQFSSLEMVFEWRDPALQIEEARTVGSDVGLTARGQIDRDKKTVAIEGTIVPAYTLNSLLGGIPILGTVLTGEKGSGVFAAAYTLRGPLDDPQVSVNPLSIVTPGILRRIFRLGGPVGEDVPERPPARE